MVWMSIRNRTMKNILIIFLDFDGVLVTNAHLDSLCFDDQEDRYGYVFTPSCKEILNGFIEKSGGKIVITSSWINDMSLWKVRRMWKYRGMSGEIIDIIANDSYDRGHKIDLWLSSHGSPNYLVIDDMDYKQFLPGQKEHLITTDGHVGLTINDILKLK